MKLSKLLLPFLLAFLLVEITVSAQTNTYMPDDNFEAWCELHGYGDGVVGNDTISTSIAATITDLPIANEGIADLTGIQAFVNLTSLNCANNNLSNIDISFLGNNLTIFNATNNTDLYCITVSDTAYAANNPLFLEDSFTSYSTNCDTAFGCMDPFGCNYNASASIDTIVGGACFYANDTIFTFDECDAFTWIFNGSLYTTSGTYYDTISTQNGCDSVGILNLIIRNSTVSYDTTIALYCDNYIWNNLYINVSGNYSFYYGLNAAGCDSTAYLAATIESSNTGTSSLVACDSYAWNGVVYNNSGTYTNTYTNDAGCDSIHTLVLTVNNSTSSTDFVGVYCDSYTWIDGMSYTASDTIATYMLQTVDGCDSLITLNLTISNSLSSYNMITSCNSYTWIDGVTYTTSGLYIENSVTSSGCTSHDTLALTINYSNTGIDNKVKCDSYTWIDGVTYTGSDNTATHTLTNAAGCDSIVTLDLIINYSNTGSLDTLVCSLYTDPLGNDYTSTAIYTFVLTNFVGCDSIVTLDLTVNFPDSSFTSFTVCDSYFWNGITYTTTDVYYFDTLTLGGCDSVAVLDLFVGYNEVNTTVVAACDNYEWLDANGNAIITAMNSTFASSGNYVDGVYGSNGVYIDTVIYTNVGGCDSIEILNLTITSSVVSTSQAIDIFACDGWMGPNGIYYTNSGSQTIITSQTPAGCDSIFTFNINIAPEKRFDIIEVACDTFTWIINNDTTGYNSTTVDSIVYTVNHYFNTDTITCDSVVYLHITINNATASTTNVTDCDSFAWNGTVYTVSGVYPFVTTNAAGCDSTATLNLTINQSTTSITTEVECDTYTWNGMLYTASGIYTYLSTNSNGCDSLATLNLTINYSYSDTLVPVISCNSFHWSVGASGSGVTYYTTGLYTSSFQTQNGCDSLILLDLTINYSNSGSTSITECDVYTWDGMTYTTSGVYTNTYTNIAGCDSTHTLNLTINYSNSSSSSEVACDAYSWDGATYTTSGLYINTYTNVAGCDSTHSLNLTINYSNTGSTDTTACDTYDWDGVAYTTTDAYTNTYTNVAGCDSVHTLNLTIDTTIVTNENVTSCYDYEWIPWNHPNQSYGFDTTSTFNAGNSSLTYIVIGNSVNLTVCKDTAYLHLTINPLEYGSDTVVYCDSYLWEGNNYTSTGVYVDTIQGTLCDSIVTLNLTINNSTSSTDFVGIHCDSYTWIDGMNYTASNSTATFTSTNAAGCDSIVTLNLTINNSSDSIITEIACDSLYWSITDTTYSTSGTHSYIIFGGNSVGCDSTVWLNLTINNSTVSTDTQVACDSLVWLDGVTYTASNSTATFTSLNAAGCTNVATLNLTINSSTTSIDTQLACDSLVWLDGVTYSASNSTATYTSTNAAGCTNVATLDLTINSSTTSTDTQVVCDTYTWSVDGNTYTTSGIYTDVSTNSSGCDHTETLNLTVNSSTTSTDTQVACDTYTWSVDGNTYTTSGIYTDVSTNSSGCDHTETLNLTINSSTTSTDTHVACDTYTWLDGVTYTASNNTATYTSTNAAGCTNVATLDLTINSSTTSTDTQVVCDTYTWSVDGNTYTTSGIYTDVSTNSSGCDHTETLNLTVNSSTTSTDTQVACDTYTWSVDGNTYTTSGIYTDLSTNSSGCDHTETLNLTINSSTTSTDTQVACDTYTWLDGVTYTASNNTATYTSTNAAGCDNVAALNLTISNSTSSTDSVGVHCDSYTWIDGNTYTISDNTASHVYTNSVGCDSTVTLDLTINNSSIGSINITACDNYTWYDGVVYDSTGSYTNLYTDVNGCDSSFTLNLTINNSSTDSVDITACDDFTWDGIVYDSTGSYTNPYTDVNGCDSSMTLNLTIATGSIDSIDITACDDFTWDGIVYDSTGFYTNPYTNVNGCDSIVTLNLIITNIGTSSIDNVGNHCDEFTWIDGVTYTNTNTTATMDYTNSAGCDSIVTLNLIINDNPVVSISSANNNLSAIATGGTSPYSYLWTGAINSTNAIVTPIVSGDYCVQVTDNNGCVSSEVCENVIISALNDLHISKFNIYPNPTSDFVNLEFYAIIKRDYAVKIISSNGDEVYFEKLLNFNGDYTKNINLSKLAKGNYIIQIYSDYQIVYRKILLQ